MKLPVQDKCWSCKNTQYISGEQNMCISLAGIEFFQYSVWIFYINGLILKLTVEKILVRLQTHLPDCNKAI